MKLNDIKRRLAQGRRWFYCGTRYNLHKAFVIQVDPVWCVVQREGSNRKAIIRHSRLVGVVEPYFEPGATS